MRYTAQRDSVSVPFSQPQMVVTLHYLAKVVGVSVTECGPLYVLQGARNGVLAKLRRGDCGEGRQQWADELFEQYISHTDEYAATLMDGAHEDDVSALICVPTKRPTFIAPYRSAYLRKNPAAIDLTDRLNAPLTWSSTSTATAEERAAQLGFEPPDGFSPGQHILVVDDVLHSGTSAAAVMMRVAQWNPLCDVRFSLACALWMVHLGSL